MKFSIIAAMDNKRGIGINNQLPWHLKADMKHFSDTTRGGTVIMGRKTWESLPEKFKPLPDRLNIVVSRQTDYELPNEVLLADSLDVALALAKNETFVIGGATLYNEAILNPHCEKLLLTEIDASFDCDAFFPEIPNYFIKQTGSELLQEGELHFTFASYIAAPPL